MNSLLLFLSLLLVLLHIPPQTAQQNTSTSSSDLSKRGLIYISTSHRSDYNIFHSTSSPLTWYYNFSPSPSLQQNNHQSPLEFTPMIHGTDSLERDISSITSQLRSNPSNTAIRNILLFNEPDGATSTGGSDITPLAAAEAYTNSIFKLRGEPYNLRLSLPATTGSPRGLQWLRDFNDSCYTLNPTRGCEVDFSAAHWYGDFVGLASWLGSLHEAYPDLPVWVTEFALPKADMQANVEMMNQSLAFLDGLEWVERYAWFGTFREDEANDWTGGGVSLLDDRGSLTELGALYLGGEERGFVVGQEASEGNAGSRRGSGGDGLGWRGVVVLVLGVAMFGMSDWI